MTGRIIVHIGLPKTATTTLQTDYFPHISGKNIQYVGTVQPRNRENQDLFYLKFINAINTGAIDDARSELMERLALGVTVIVSEEMITVSQDKMPWRAKLKNLSKLLDSTEYTLVVTVREPAAAMFSYYVELYTRFFTNAEGFVDVALNNEMMEIYHYKKLLHNIYEGFERDRIFVKKFEDIVAGNTDDLTRVIVPDIVNDSLISLRNNNERRRSVGFVYTGKDFTVSDIGRKILSWLGVTDSEFTLKVKKWIKPIVRVLDNVPLSLSKQKVVKPSSEDMKKIKNYLREETYFLEEFYGIKYE